MGEKKMNRGKKGSAPSSLVVNKSNHSMNPDRPKDGLKGVAKPRTRSTIKRLQMYRNFKPKRDSRGKIIKAAPFQVSAQANTSQIILIKTNQINSNV